jgi:hypothetical protein
MRIAILGWLRVQFAGMMRLFAGREQATAEGINVPSPGSR